MNLPPSTTFPAADRDAETQPMHGAHLVDFLFARLAGERATFAIYGKLLERHGQSVQTLARSGLSPSRLETFHLETGERINLLVQALDILNGEGEQPADDMVESSRLLMQPLQDMLAAPALHPLMLLHGLSTVARLGESAWELLLVLIKDADVARLIPHFERACLRYGEQRMWLQQNYEDLALQLVRQAGSAARPKNVATPGASRVRNHGMSVFFSRRKARPAQA